MKTHAKAHTHPIKDNTNTLLLWRGRNPQKSTTDFIYQEVLYVYVSLEGESAKMAANLGVAGIFVSNHGGRQLDGVAATVN